MSDTTKENIDHITPYHELDPRGHIFDTLRRDQTLLPKTLNSGLFLRNETLNKSIPANLQIDGTSLNLQADGLSNVSLMDLPRCVELNESLFSLETSNHPSIMNELTNHFERPFEELVDHPFPNLLSSRETSTCNSLNPKIETQNLNPSQENQSVSFYQNNFTSYISNHIFSKDSLYLEFIHYKLLGVRHQLPSAHLCGVSNHGYFYYTFNQTNPNILSQEASLAQNEIVGVYCIRSNYAQINLIPWSDLLNNDIVKVDKIQNLLPWTEYKSLTKAYKQGFHKGIILYEYLKSTQVRWSFKDPKSNFYRVFASSLLPTLLIQTPDTSLIYPQHKWDFWGSTTQSPPDCHFFLNQNNHILIWYKGAFAFGKQNQLSQWTHLKHVRELIQTGIKIYNERVNIDARQDIQFFTEYHDYMKNNLLPHSKNAQSFLSLLSSQQRDILNERSLRVSETSDKY